MDQSDDKKKELNEVVNNENQEENASIETVENEIMPINEENNSSDETNEAVKEVRSGNQEKKQEGLMTFNQKTEQKKKHLIQNKAVRLTVMILGIILLNLAILFGVIVCINRLNTKVYKNVYLFGNDMSGKTQEEVIEYLKSKSENLTVNEKVSIFQGDENIYSVRADDFGFNIDIAKTAQEVLDFGRDSNIFVDNFQIIKAMFQKQNIDPVYTYNEEQIQEILKNIDITIKDRFVDDTYRIDEETYKLVITKGKTGNTIDYENEKQKIIQALKEDKTEKVELTLIQKKPTMLDANQVYSEVKREAKDAYLDETVQPVKVVGEVVGLDFKVEELQALLEKEENQEEGKVIEFQLVATQPNKTVAQISYMLYKDKLGGMTTYFSPSLRARSNNLEIALNYLNGKVIMPGETFSYNAAIGDINASKGYQPASTFVGGREVMEIGGGICQTVSTLYNAVLYANLEIVERHQHGLPVAYVAPSRDATVYSPSLDFKFKNNRNYPVKIITSFSWGGELNVSIFGTKEKDEYEVILGYKLLRYIPFSTSYIYDNTMAKGQQVIVTKGVQGYSSEGYITKKLNGKTVSSGILSRDTYNPQKQVVKVGTKEEAPSQVQ